MLPRPLSIVLATLFAVLASPACAQPRSAPVDGAVPRPATNRYQPLADPALGQVRAALDEAGRGRFDPATAGALREHPLYPWIELAALQHGLSTLDTVRAEAFLRRHAGTPAAAVFREAWLGEAARRRDDAAFLASWDDGIDGTRLRCARLDAQQRLGRTDAAWNGDAQAIWRSSGSSLPDACDPVFAALDAAGGLSPALRWERFDLAAQAWQPGVMRAIARGLPAAERPLAEDYAAFLDAPHPRALQWPKTARSRLVATHGLARLGKADPDRAEALLPQYVQALALDAAQRGQVLYQIALWTVASYLPGADRRLAQVPAANYDERLHEWRVREALARSDWPAALAAIRAMGEPQRNDSRYAYFEARLAELTGDAATARTKYQAAARAPEFHGFLAADRIDAPYPLCPLHPRADTATVTAVGRDPGLRRAMALHRLGRHGWAVKEWQAAIAGFDDTRRQLAVELAQANDWFDRAMFSLGRGKPDELRLYSLRFPLHHQAAIRREAARQGIDPAWVAAEIRAESIFNPRARSAADARGLMQVLPGTGAAVARRIGQSWHGGESLYDPDTNITLGTAYLRQMLDASGGKPYLAIAGYNAGPTPLARWQAQRPHMDPDFWIETISYKETREYVARVFAFSVIYDWRLDGDALRLADRMHGRTRGTRTAFACPTPATATAAPATGS